MFRKPKITYGAAPKAARMAVMAHYSQRVSAPVRKARFASFLDGVFLGFGGASLFLAGTLPPPLAPKVGLRDDWEAVGRDLAVAMQQYDVASEG
jgi:hypothetical protein